MHVEFLPAGPRVLYGGGDADVAHLLADIQLAEPPHLFVVIAQGVELVAVLLVDVLNVTQPVVDESTPFAVEGRRDAAASVVTTYDDVFDLQGIHRVLHHRQHVHVGVHHEVGDVAVDEHLARQHVHDLVRGYPAVGAADPEVLRRLDLREAREELRVLRAHPVGPGAVAVEKVGEGLHA